MSELGLSLEDDQSAEIPQDPPAQTTEAPAQAAPPPAQAADGDPDGTIEGTGGVKFVPLGAVVDLRGKVREKETALAEKEAKIAELEAKAQKLAQIEGDWQRVQPLIQQIQQQQFQPPQAPKPQVNERALQYAKDLDLYKPDGTLDVDRAERIMAYNAAQAQETAKALVAPIYQQTAQQQSALMLEKVANQPAANGITVDRSILNEIWAMVPVEMSARPEVAAMLWRQALADTVLQGKYKAPVTPPPPVMTTESLGGGAAKPELSSFERNFLSSAGIKTNEYEKISSRFKPGERNELE